MEKEAAITVCKQLAREFGIYAMPRQFAYSDEWHIVVSNPSRMYDHEFVMSVCFDYDLYFMDMTYTRHYDDVHYCLYRKV